MSFRIDAFAKIAILGLGLTGALVGCAGGLAVLSFLLTAGPVTAAAAPSPELLTLAVVGIAGGALAFSSGLGVLAGSIGLVAILDRPGHGSSRPA